MSKSEKKMQDSFLELLKIYPIEDISVIMLCDKLKMKRQTFYYHYQSIYDLIFSIFYEMKIESNKNDDFRKIIEDLETFLKNNDYLCKAILDTFASSILEEFISSYYYRSLKNLYSYKEKTCDINFIKFISKGLNEITISLYKDNKFNYNNLCSIFKKFTKEFSLIDECLVK